MLDRLTRKFHTAKRLVPKPIIEQDAGIDIAVVAYGSSDGAVREALDILAAHGIKTNYMRLRAFPFSDSVRDFFASHDRVYVIEENRDAQMAGMLRMEMPDTSPKIRSVLHYDGLPLDAQSVVEAILGHETH